MPWRVKKNVKKIYLNEFNFKERKGKKYIFSQSQFDVESHKSNSKIKFIFSIF